MASNIMVYPHNPKVHTNEKTLIITPKSTPYFKKMTNEVAKLLTCTDTHQG
jgi:hypothetical protein